MKTLRSICLVGLLVALAACAEDSEVPPGSGRGGICTEGASVTREEIEAGGVLCEHQTLVASIRPGDDVKLAFHVFTQGDVDLCFEDDDGEPHEVSLGGHVVQAKAPCQTVSLSAGDQILGLRHAMREAAAQDSSPDVVHTKWTPPTSASRGRLLVATNACRGCKLTGPWPALVKNDRGTDDVRGYVGDYTGATIGGTCRDFGGFCQLGGLGIPTLFNGANIVVDIEAAARETFIGDADQHHPAATALRDATVEVHGEVLVYNTDASNTKFSGEGRPGSPDDLLEFDDCIMRGADITSYRGGEVDVNGADVDVVTYSAFLQRPNTYFGIVNVSVTPGQSLANLTIDGNPGRFTTINVAWPRDGAGRLAMNRAAFDKATLRHLNFGCLRGGDLQGASFAGATLDDVALTGCDLTGARFKDATLTSVTAARNTLLIRADLTDVTINGLDVSDASLSGATLRNAANKPATGLVARRVTAGGLMAKDLVTVLDANALGADFSGAILPAAVFTNAQLPRALFTSAALKATDFSGATLSGASFDGATGLGTIFDKAHLESSGEPRTSLFDVRFEGPNFNGAFLRGAKMTSARVCGGQFLGADLRGVELTGTLMPLISDKFSIAGVSGPPLDCFGLQDLVTATTDVATSCPGGLPGPCVDGAWIPANFTPTCAAPRHRASGFACDTACDCKLLKCISGKCA